MAEVEPIAIEQILLSMLKVEVWWTNGIRGEKKILKKKHFCCL